MFVKTGERYSLLIVDLILEIIDRVLEEDDSDRDGYLSYPEFVDGGRRSKIDKQPVVLAVK